MANGWTTNQYRLFRVLLGTYLFVHFAALVPWAGEVFSNAGMLADATRSPLFGIVPNVLALAGGPQFVIGLVAAAAIAAACFACGYLDKLAAIFMWYVLACLFARNPLIANPALPYVGWMLLLHLFVPALPRATLTDARWEFPKPLFAAAWIVLALAYSYSGYTKLLSPSWVSGDAIAYVLDNPLARDNAVRDLFLALPGDALRVLTWSLMAVELLFAPLALVRKARPVLWVAMLVAQVGFLCLLNFADLTIPMLLFHMLTFDPAWVPGNAPERRDVIFYDGECGLCHGAVRFVLAEDRRGRTLFSPLQGATFKRMVRDDVRKDLPDSFVVLDDAGELLLRSSAVVHVAMRLGGWWRVLGTLLFIVPKPIRDAGYRFVGAVRHRLFARPSRHCPFVPASMRARFRE